MSSGRGLNLSESSSQGETEPTVGAAASTPVLAALAAATSRRPSSSFLASQEDAWLRGDGGGDDGDDDGSSQSSTRSKLARRPGKRRPGPASRTGRAQLPGFSQSTSSESSSAPLVPGGSGGGSGDLGPPAPKKRPRQSTLEEFAAVRRPVDVGGDRAAAPSTSAATGASRAGTRRGEEAGPSRTGNSRAARPVEDRAVPSTSKAGVGVGGVRRASQALHDDDHDFETRRRNKKTKKKKKPSVDSRFAEMRRAVAAAASAVPHLRTHTDIPRLPFGRMVRDVAQGMGFTGKFQSAGLMALQEGAESYLLRELEAANLLVLHANRVTLMDRDMRVLKRIKDTLGVD